VEIIHGEKFDYVNVDDIEEYAKFELPTIVGDGSRNVLLFKEACRLRNDNYSAGEIFWALKGINQKRCKPPLSIGELRIIASSASKYDPKRDVFSTTNDENNAQSGDEFVTLGELLSENDAPVEELVGGLIRCGSTVLVIAKPKVGKTTFCMNGALSVARGEQFLGRNTKKGVVLYVALEGARSEWRERFRAMGGTKEDTNLHVYAARAPKDAMKWLNEQCEKYHPILVVVDPLQKFSRIKKMEDYAEVSIAFEGYTGLSQKFGCSVWIPHHGKKVDTGDSGDNVLGSTAIFGGVDTLIALKKGTGGVRTFEIPDPRYGEAVEETVMGMDPKTRVITVAGSKHDVTNATHDAEMLAALNALGAKGVWVDRPEFLRDFGGKAETTRNTFNRLLSDGRVVQRGSGLKGDSFLYAVAGTDMGKQPARRKTTTVTGHTYQTINIDTIYDPDEH
jgi:hypothetical protein